MIYFDNSATTFPKPQNVLDEMYQFMKNDMANPGRSGHKMAMETAKRVFLVRVEIAEMFNISNPLQIAFTKNASEAINIAIQGVIKAQNHVITSVMEHNSVVRPLYRMKEQGLIELDFVKSDKEGFVHLEEIKKLIKDDTKMICITHASNVLGSINDIKAIGNYIFEINQKRENKIIFMVDTAQTAGYVDIDVCDMKIDILATAGHKGLYGPSGTGFVYVSEDININPVYVGGTGSFSESLVQPTMMPDILETGTLNAVGIVGLGEGIKYIKSKGIENIKEHYQKLVSHAILELSKIEDIKIYGSKDATKRSAVVCFNIGDMDSQEVVRHLSEEYDIASRGALHCAVLAHTEMGTLEQGMIRISFSTFNKIEEVDIFIKAVKEIRYGKRQ